MATQAQIEANARIVVRSLMSGPDALPLVSACAVAGNGWRENLMSPLTSGAKDHGSDGLLQWRLSRLDELQRYKNWDTLPVQCQFFKDECKRDYPGLWAQLANPGNRTLANLTANICDIYERPSAAGRVIDERIGYAKRVFALFDVAPPPQPLPTPAGVPQPVIEALLWLLSNVFGGAGSTVLGILALAYVFAPPLAANWQVLLLLAVTLIFGVGGEGVPKQAEPPLAPETPKGNTPMLDPNMVKAFAENLVPLLERVVPILVSLEPVLKNLSDGQQTQAQRLAAIEQGLANAEQASAPANSSLQDALNRLNQLSNAIRPQG
jgi:hypothetical protein